ncbi:hypothetical protein BUALT_Bualt12G0117700 [Buddleja alternifolia]|uniref:Chromo domain-containing protein n=1 Tax=Buddleja alternifolia TaxID=168488 RepID=A0AAV6X121_9LAMI|nr:hypothetical protein BUALT_Bualt12G0117700 [Buddleja alternifolia]
MVETTRNNTELRKDVDALKESCERTEKTLEEMRSMMASMFANQYQHTVHGGLGHFGENGGESPLNHGASWTPGYQIPSKVSRVDFPHFNGEDLRGWLYKCEQCFEVDDTPSNAKVKLVVVHLEGKALQWHQMFMKSRLTREVPNWEEYIRALNDRFGALVYDDPMLELVNLKQVGTIQQYLDKFDEIVNCMDLPDHYALSCFLGGLKGEISVNVRMFRPKSLQEAISLEKLQEQAISITQKRPPLFPKSIPFPPKSQPNNAEATSPIFSLQGNTIQDKLQLQNLLEEFGDLFEEPTTVPPHRDQDNKIILKEGTYLISLRPYRYPARQKDEIEKMDAFKWSGDAETAFLELKNAMTRATVLAMPDFNEEFIIKADASGRVLEPEKILDRRVVNRNNRSATQWLIKWFNAPIEESTWEFLHDLRIKFPHFNP